jgi:hypothetical protein
MAMSYEIVYLYQDHFPEHTNSMADLSVSAPEAPRSWYNPMRFFNVFSFAGFDDDVWMPDEYTKFHPFFYSVDVFIPLINLHQQDSWLPMASTSDGEPDGWGIALWVFLWLQIISGWIFTSLIAASLVGIIKKE